MKAMRMPLSELKKPKRNIRIHTETQLIEFERSVSMFGQIRPIVIDENNEILAGNGLYDTLLRLGWTEADVYKFEDLTAAQKKKLMIADNKVFGLGIDDLDTLDAFLVELDGDFDIPGFDADILRSMVSCPDDVTEAMADYGKLSEDEISGLRSVKERGGGEPQNSQDEAFANGAERGSGGRRCSTICPNCGAEIWL